MPDDRMALLVRPFVLVSASDGTGAGRLACMDGGSWIFSSSGSELSSCRISAVRRNATLRRTAMLESSEEDSTIVVVIYTDVYCNPR